MKETIYKFNREQREILVKGLKSLCFYDLKSIDFEMCEELEKELGE
jgi:hypothetical protein